MAEENKWIRRIRETFTWTRNLHWLWTLFPASWKAFPLAIVIGAVGFVLALIRRLNLAQAWLYSVGGLAIYGFGWLCVQIAQRIRESGPTATIKITGYELHRSPEPQGLNGIFFRSKIELSGTRRATVTRYRMELSCAGVLTSPQFRDDVEKFEITDWSREPIPHDDMRPLPKELNSGDPVEGWVHFVTDWDRSKLQRSYVRLIADTSKGSGSVEIKAGPEYWNAVPNRLIVEKDFGSTTLDQL